MIVCIAEKPSVARDIARILGANSSHDGYMEGNGYQVTWTFGHLCTLKEPGDYTPAWRTGGRTHPALGDAESTGHLSCQALMDLFDD